jgi:hypothetical protein
MTSETESTNEQGATSRGEREVSQQDQVNLEAPVVGGEGGCCVETLAQLLEKPQEDIRGLLVAKLEMMKLMHSGASKSHFLGDVAGDRFHHNVVRDVLRDLGYKMTLLKCNEYPKMFDMGFMGVVYGELNFKFQPYSRFGKSNKVRFLNNEFADAQYYGNVPIDDAHDAGQYHCIALRDNRLYCGNLAYADGRCFGVKASQILPFKQVKKDNQQYCIKNSKSAYLNCISQVFELSRDCTEASPDLIPAASPDSISPMRRNRISQLLTSPLCPLRQRKVLENSNKALGNYKKTALDKKGEDENSVASYFSAETPPKGKAVNKEEEGKKRAASKVKATTLQEKKPLQMVEKKGDSSELSPLTAESTTDLDIRNYKKEAKAESDAQHMKAKAESDAKHKKDKAEAAAKHKKDKADDAAKIKVLKAELDAMKRKMKSDGPMGGSTKAADHLH